MMNREQFDQFVHSIEQRYHGRPVALRLKLAMLAALSYAVFAVWFVFAALIGGILIAGGIAMGEKDAWWLIAFGSVIVIAFAISIGRMLWVKLAAPEGHAVTRRGAPALFTMLDDLRISLRSARFHRVVVDGRCNASVVQQPRLGIFGWQRNHLVLGLPLLDVLSAAELRAVLAHECTHLSAQHGRFSAWIYRTRRSWEQVFEEFRKPRQAGSFSFRPVLVKFVDWFWPRFNAHAFALSRANEYEADRGAAQLAGTEHVASSLLRVEYYDRVLGERAWEDVKLAANREPEPPNDVFLKLRDALRAGAPADDAAKWIEQAFRSTTTNADTHPSLSDRLRALGFYPADLARGVFPPAPIAPRTSASEELLETQEPLIRKALSEQWQRDCKDAWHGAHARAGALQHRLERIDAAPAVGADAEMLWDKAQVLINLENTNAAETLLHQVLSLNPSHTAANFTLGRHLLARGDSTGEPLIERAIDEDEELIAPGCELLLDFHRRHGNEPRVKEFVQRLDAHETAMRASHAERNSVTAADTFLPPDLTGTELATLHSTLASYPDVRAVHVARKQLRHFAKQRLFVVLITPRRKWFGAEDRDMALVAKLSSALQLPGRTLVITDRAPWGGVANKVRRITGTDVYRCGG